MKRHRKHIGLLDTSLCSGCGFCVAVCPSSAISLIIRNGFYKAHVDETRCISCKLCLKTCPSISNPNQSISDSEHTRYNPLIGRYIAVFYLTQQIRSLDLALLLADA